MITVECIGKLNGENNICISFINNIYQDNIKIGKFSEEFCSIALNILDKEINKGDKFILRVIDNNKNIIKDSECIFDHINGGSLYYDE